MLESNYTLPGVTPADATQLVGLLQGRLSAYNDLHLTLKHIHWNVVGPNFIGVHEMIDPQVDTVRNYADEVAERVAALGGSPNGTPEAIIKYRTWNNYSLGRAESLAHLGALDLVYTGVLESNREAISEMENLDLVTQDLIIGHTEQLEQYQWFVRAHLENAGGKLSTANAHTEAEAAAQAEKNS